MTIGELIGQGLYYARTCKSLWIFGFFVGLASGGSSPAGGGGQGGGGGIAAPFLFPFFALSLPQIALIAAVLALVAIVAVVLRFLGEGALIEGVARVHKGGSMTTSEGFRAGWAHWGVLLRIGLLYFAVMLGSVALLVAPIVVAVQTLGPLAGIAVGLLALAIGVPWLITLHLVQAFASRIAVLENRHALDAIAKARLFLHGRLMHGLTLIVATFVGSLLLAVISVVVLAPLALLLIALIPVLDVLPVIVLGCLVLLPAMYVLTAMVGTLRSSIWTIGYMTQVES